MGKLYKSYLKNFQKKHFTIGKGAFLILENVSNDGDEFNEDCEKICLHIAEYSAQEDPTFILNIKIPQPKIGACLFVDNKLFISSRSGKRIGDHAEFTVIEEARKENRNLSNSILFTSLEPCTKHSRHKWTTSCAEFIFETGIREVHVGCLDANPAIAGLGIARLLDACEVYFFSKKGVEKSKLINADFFESFETAIDGKTMKDVISCIKENLDEFAVALFLNNKIDIISDIKLTYDDWFVFFTKMVLNHSITRGDILKYDVIPEFALAFYKEPTLLVPNFSITIYDDREKSKSVDFNFSTSSIISMLANTNNDKTNIYTYILKHLLKKNLPPKDYKGMAQRLFSSPSHNSNLGRELIANALVHADYSNGRGVIDFSLKNNELIIFNPVTQKGLAKKLKDIPSYSYPTNPRLMLFLKQAGLVEMKHYGMSELSKQSKGVIDTTYEECERKTTPYLVTHLKLQ